MVARAISWVCGSRNMVGFGFGEQMVEMTNQPVDNRIIYRGTSEISVEKFPDYNGPVAIKVMIENC